MAKFGSGKKPAKQGTSGGGHTQQPKTSGKPKTSDQTGAAQKLRGFHTPGKGGSGTKGSPKSFKA